MKICSRRRDNGGEDGFTKVPIGFCMELAQDVKAMQRYAILAKEEKWALLKRARSARSETEMRQIVMSIAGNK